MGNIANPKHSWLRSTFSWWAGGARVLFIPSLAVDISTSSIISQLSTFPADFRFLRISSFVSHSLTFQVNLPHFWLIASSRKSKQSPETKHYIALSWKHSTVLVEYRIA
jgi:hypothetical protein